MLSFAILLLFNAFNAQRAEEDVGSLQDFLVSNQVQYELQGRGCLNKPWTYYGRQTKDDCAKACKHNNNCKLFSTLGTKCWISTSLTGTYRGCNGWFDDKEDVYMILTGDEPKYELVKANVECKSGDSRLQPGGSGMMISLTACAVAAKNRKGTKYFIFGTGSKKGYCYAEHTSSERCPEGWESDSYNFYKLKEEKKDSREGWYWNEEGVGSVYLTQSYNEESSLESLAVYGFAAIGLAAVLYGSYKKCTESKLVHETQFQEI